jgi:hypothetical protein
LRLDQLQPQRKLDADWLAGDAILLELDRRMVCTACGHIGADVRPDWSQNTPLGTGQSYFRGE